MSRETRCATCGKPLPSPDADCSACLLNLALEASSGDDRPKPGAGTDRHTLTAGSRVGPYTIVRELGEGGMGIVYLAEQTEPIKRHVALKVIKHGMDTDQVVKRFEAERQALALMDHVAIARVHEAGETAAGRPYFAMEFIDGEPITSYCDRNRFDTAQRLALFSRVCDGLQHAHQRGIIHRDIKPSNVLVADTDGEAQPKIIDFGVAKATEQSLTDRSALTALGVLLGTPEYMSPEQADLTPFDVDTRTDVYSLGVLLYELLTGALPFDTKKLREAAFDEIRRQIREVRPSKPSTRISELGEQAGGMAMSRRADVSSLSRRIAGDLDLITMKALEKERDRRYGSPAELAADIRRHLADEPVLARPPSAVYQLSKLISRNKLPAALIIGFFVVAIGFAILMALLYRDSQANLKRAQQAESEAAQVSDFLVGVFAVSDPGEARGNTATARELLDNAAEKIDEDLADQPEVQATMMHTMGRVYTSLGLFEPSVDLLQRAVEKREGHFGPDALAVAESLTVLSGVRTTLGEYEEAEKLAQRALSIVERQGNKSEDRIGPLSALQVVYWKLRDYDRSLPIAEQLVETSEEAHGRNSEETAAAVRSLAIIHTAMDNMDEAEVLYREVIEIQQAFYDSEHPATVATRLNLAEMYRHEGRYDLAEEMLLEIQDIQSRMYDEEHPARAVAFNNLGLVYSRTDRFDEAIEQFKTAIAIREKALPENHPLLAWTYDNLGLAYLYAGRLDEAAETIQRALDIAMVAVGPDNADTGIVLANLGLVRTDQKRYDEAEALYRRVLEIDLKVFGREHSETASTLNNIGKILYQTRRFDEAEKMYRESLDIMIGIYGEEHVDVGNTTIGLGYALEQQGRLDDAEKYVREGTRIMEMTLGAEHQGVIDAKEGLERILAKIEESSGAT